ncbi:MAG: metal ABC transporter substrate-binding protein [Propionivibrio sp.]|uniref:metal ABC transporter substrate-binding protein n=1 Tax=Propionivibrio sp. TaxID=2212460 RepID=UPI001A37D8A5|nr:metal ABC transporter substrate-binding protein [Propionivibrio sp.]MBL8416442.1 metal ABC transporter substrate-binding protein [Propionivibrio sp.]
MKSFPKSRFGRLATLGFLVFIGLISLIGSAAAETLNVVATFSIVGDMTQRVGGERIQVHTLVGQDADAHVYQPTPADARTLAQARLVVVNGFGFEGWIERLIKSSGYRGKVLTASSGVKTIKLPHLKDERGHAQHGDVDPHAWQDLSNALIYVDNIAQALSEADPAGQAVYQAHAAKYKQEISALDGEIRQAFKTIPIERRRVVTSHDAFGYFSRAYGIGFIAPVGINTDAEPSAGDVGRIIEQIRREKIPAVFLESISDPRLLERIRQESGARIGGTLYSDSLSKAGGPAPTYLDLMRHNAKMLAAALGK